jgi:hypothetical protein
VSGRSELWLDWQWWMHGKRYSTHNSKRSTIQKNRIKHTSYDRSINNSAQTNVPSWSGRPETFEWVRERDIRFKFWLLT